LSSDATSFPWRGRQFKISFELCIKVRGTELFKQDEFRKSWKDFVYTFLKNIPYICFPKL